LVIFVILGLACCSRCMSDPSSEKDQYPLIEQR
jgi:hypothetical protein